VRAGALAVMALAGCTPQPEAPLDVSPFSNPTIVSLNPCADAILVEVAEPHQLLAISHYSHDPSTSSIGLEKARNFAVTGAAAEEIIALDPDIVVTDTFLAPATRTALEDAGIRVQLLGIANDLDASLAQVRELAALAGQEQRGAVLAQHIETAWQESASDSEPLKTLLWQFGGIVPGEGTLAAQMLEHSGFTLQDAARDMGQGAYLPLERVLADPPPLILAAGEERMLTHPVLQRLEGVRYESFDPTLLFCGGPTIPSALERLRAIRQSVE
jgi:iron complex transport system substrate-binding protein